jgi:hypothetical protein
VKSTLWQSDSPWEPTHTMYKQLWAPLCGEVVPTRNAFPGLPFRKALCKDGDHSSAKLFMWLSPLHPTEGAGWQGPQPSGVEVAAGGLCVPRALWAVGAPQEHKDLSLVLETMICSNCESNACSSQKIHTRTQRSSPTYNPSTIHHFTALPLVTCFQGLLCRGACSLGRH